MPDQIDPALWSRPDLQAALATHDIATLFRALSEIGLGQYQIAELIGRSQSRVSDMASGRSQVIAYDVLVGLAEGLLIPRERLGLSFFGPGGKYYGPKDAYPGGGQVANIPEGVSAAVLRRHLVAWGGIIMAGVPVAGVGELLDDLGDLPPVAPPSQVTTAHVAGIIDLTHRLENTRRSVGSDPATSSDVATRAEQLLTVPGPEPVKQTLRAAVAGLHMHAGRTAFNGCLYARTLHHFAKALELARQAQDFVLQAEALGWAGRVTIEHGHPNDGLKMLQAAQVAAWNIPRDDPRRAAAEACPLMDSATALAALGEHPEAYRRVGTARDLWTPTTSDRYGDMDRGPALLEIERGRLDMAEHYAAASVRRWEDTAQIGRITSGIILATVNVQAGEQRGLHLAHNVITAATKLTSLSTRRQLVPLAVALEARPSSDARELARMARQVAA